MADRAIILEWLAKADEDFGFASALVNNAAHAARACFHFQQAAEHYLKAFLVAAGTDPGSGHDLMALFGCCRSIEPPFGALREHCVYLNAYYLDNCHPVGWPRHYTPGFGIDAKHAAAAIGTAVRESLIRSNRI